MYNDLKVKEELERCVATACIVAGLDTRKFPAKFMGKKKRENNLSLKYAYYAILQNFNSLSVAKKSKTDVYFRYIFRTILFRERTKLLYEISKWEPSMGSVENAKVVFRSDQPDKYSGEFIDHITTLMKFTKYELYKTD